MLATFDHVIDEMRLLINAALKEFSAGREYGPLGDRLRSESGFSTYAVAVRDSIEERLRDALGITVLRYEIYDRGDRERYFSNAQLDSLRNSIGDAHYQLERRQRDAMSIAGVIRLKKENRRPASIFSAGTTFLTRNSRLCKDANRFLSIGRAESDPRFAVVLDSQLLPIIWFANGANERFSEMSHARLIANCAAAMVPQREVVHKIADYLVGISPKLKQEFTALMTDDRAKLCPMNYTFGISSTIDQQFAADMVDKMKAELSAPFVEEGDRQKRLNRRVVEGLKLEVQNSKGNVLVLQGVVEKFDADLAQAILDRDRFKAARDESDRLIEQMAASKLLEAHQIVSKCDRQASLIKRAFAYLLWLFVFVSSVYVVVSDDVRGYIAVASTLVCAALFGTGQRWADGTVDRFIEYMQASRRKRARGLQHEADELKRSVLRD